MKFVYQCDEQGNITASFSISGNKNDPDHPRQFIFDEWQDTRGKKFDLKTGELVDAPSPNAKYAEFTRKYPDYGAVIEALKDGQKRQEIIADATQVIRTRD